MIRALLAAAVAVILLVTPTHAQQTAFNGGQAFYPTPPRVTAWAFDTTSLQINASGEVAVLVVRMPVACVINQFATILAAVANAPDNGLRFSLQSVDATTGLQTGTILEGTNAFATVASGSVAVGFLASGSLAASHSAARGELLAFVLDIPTFTAGDDLIVRGMSGSGQTISNSPYSISATSTRSTVFAPIIVAHCSDGGAGFWQQLSPSIIPATANLTAVTIDSGTNPDQIGAVFIPTQPGRLNSVIFPLAVDAAGGDFDIIVYDGSDNVLDTVSYDGDVIGNPANTTVIQFEHWLSAPLTLSAGSTYRIILKPTTTNNVRTNYLPIADTVIEAVPGEMVNFFFTTKDGASAWIDYNDAGDGYRFPTLILAFDAFDAGGSGGGRIIGGQH